MVISDGLILCFFEKLLIAIIVAIVLLSLTRGKLFSGFFTVYFFCLSGRHFSATSGGSVRIATRKEQCKSY